MKKQAKKPARIMYSRLLKDIGHTIERARQEVVIMVNHQLVSANWSIGRHIIQYEQGGHERAEYGSELLVQLSRDLRRAHGKGFSRRNLLDMRRFYLAFPEWRTVSAKLSWSHYISLVSLSSDRARNFYFEQCVSKNWSVRELEREINASLFERIELSRNKRMLPKPARAEQEIVTPQDAIKDPYVLEFLMIPPDKRVTEKMLEQRIINHLQAFLLELGKGFSFVARQHPVSIRNKHFYVDLVFYHRILKCFVLLDLKTRDVRHSDVGQMNLYLNYFKAEENTPGDNDPIGIILSAEKDEVLVEFAMGGISNKIFVSRYQLHLPEKKIIRRRVLEAMGQSKLRKRTV